jgi:hypothetical protein
MVRDWASPSAEPASRSGVQPSPISPTRSSRDGFSASTGSRSKTTTRWWRARTASVLSVCAGASRRCVLTTVVTRRCCDCCFVMDATWVSASSGTIRTGFGAQPTTSKSGGSSTQEWGRRPNASATGLRSPRREREPNGQHHLPPRNQNHAVDAPCRSCTSSIAHPTPTLLRTPTCCSRRQLRAMSASLRRCSTRMMAKRSQPSPTAMVGPSR